MGGARKGGRAQRRGGRNVGPSTWSKMGARGLALAEQHRRTEPEPEPEPEPDLMTEEEWRSLQQATYGHEYQDCPDCGKEYNDVGREKIAGGEFRPVIICTNCRKKYRPR